MLLSQGLSEKRLTILWKIILGKGNFGRFSLCDSRRQCIDELVEIIEKEVWI